MMVWIERRDADGFVERRGPFVRDSVEHLRAFAVAINVADRHNKGRPRGRRQYVYVEPAGAVIPGRSAAQATR